DAEQVVGLSGHPVELGDLRDRRYERVKCIEPGKVMPIRPNRHEHRDAYPKAPPVEQRNPTANDPRFLEMLDAPPAWRGCQAHAGSQRGQRDARVSLQYAQDGEVEPVESVHGMVFHESPTA